MNPKLSRRVISQAILPFLPLALALISGCDVYYSYEDRAGETGRLAVGLPTYGWDTLFLAVVAGIAIGYPAIYRNITHKEIGRRRLFALRALIGLVAAAFFYTRTWYNLNHYWEADPNGIREVSIYRTQEMAWDDAYRVWADRKNMRDVTKELSVLSPMFHVIGPNNEAIIVRGEEVGDEPFEKFASHALELYYRRPVLWKAQPENGKTAPAQAGEQPAAGITESVPAGTPPDQPAPLSVPNP